MKLWKRYLFSQLIQLFFFLLFCLFLIYVLVDFSIHGVKFLSSVNASFVAIAFYYLHLFSEHWELFASLSFLLASLKILLDLSAHLELVALQMAGLSRKKLLTPFFLFAAILAISCYCNSQWISPGTPTLSKEKKKNVYNIALDDDSELIYQRFDSVRKELFDVFWIRHVDDLWHMKYLHIDTKPVRGRLVDHFIRNSSGQFEKKETFSTHEFPHLLWSDEVKLQRFIPFENRSLLTLLQQSSAVTAHRDSALSHLHYKCAMPLLSLLILLFISPISMRFARTRPTFLLVAAILFTYIGFITFMDAMLILGENRVLPPTLAIWAPFLLLTLFTLPSFSKMR